MYRQFIINHFYFNKAKLYLSYNCHHTLEKMQNLKTSWGVRAASQVHTLLSFPLTAPPTQPFSESPLPLGLGAPDSMTLPQRNLWDRHTPQKYKILRNNTTTDSECKISLFHLLKSALQEGKEGCPQWGAEKPPDPCSSLHSKLKAFF